MFLAGLPPAVAAVDGAGAARCVDAGPVRDTDLPGGVSKLRGGETAHAGVPEAPGAAVCGCVWYLADRITAAGGAAFSLDRLGCRGDFDPLALAGLGRCVPAGAGCRCG